jgi:hypothetical protein
VLFLECGGGEGERDTRIREIREAKGKTVHGFFKEKEWVFLFSKQVLFFKTAYML